MLEVSEALGFWDSAQEVVDLLDSEWFRVSETPSLSSSLSMLLVSLFLAWCQAIRVVNLVFWFRFVFSLLVLSLTLRLWVRLHL